MFVLVRKVSPAKWAPVAGARIAEDAIAADAVTADLRTQGNTLSFWRCDIEADAAEAKPSPLAMKTRSKALDDICLVFALGLDGPAAIRLLAIPENRFATPPKSSDGKAPAFNVMESQGLTDLIEIRDWHRDLVDLDLMGIERIAKMIQVACRGELFIEYRAAEVTALVRRAVEETRVDPKMLKPKWLEKLNLQP